MCVNELVCLFVSAQSLDLACLVVTLCTTLLLYGPPHHYPDHLIVMRTTSTIRTTPPLSGSSVFYTNLVLHYPDLLKNMNRLKNFGEKPESNLTSIYQSSWHFRMNSFLNSLYEENKYRVAQLKPPPLLILIETNLLNRKNFMWQKIICFWIARFKNLKNCKYQFSKKRGWRFHLGHPVELLNRNLQTWWMQTNLELRQKNLIQVSLWLFICKSLFFLKK